MLCLGIAWRDEQKLICRDSSRFFLRLVFQRFDRKFDSFNMFQQVLSIFVLSHGYIPNGVVPDAEFGQTVI